MREMILNNRYRRSALPHRSNAGRRRPRVGETGPVLPDPASISNIAFYTTGFFTTRNHDVIVLTENRAMPGKEKEMILRQFSVLLKSEYKDLSLCSFEYEQHAPLACPYKTGNKTVKRQP